MYPYINIGTFQIPIYFIMSILGLLLAGNLIFINNAIHKNYRLPKKDILYLMIYILIGVILGARLLFILTLVPKIIEHPHLFIIIIFSGGTVFYGGLIGGLVGGFIYIKQYGLDPQKYSNLFFVAIPLGHAFGRLGCFFAGCCHGRMYDGIFAVKFPHIEYTVHPTQLYESFINFLIFGFMIILFYNSNRHRAYYFSGLYLILYSISRFIIEFFRGDDIRGIYFISVSQWISIVIFIIGLLVLSLPLDKYPFFQKQTPKSRSYLKHTNN